MLIVAVGLDASGKIRTLRPLVSAYSVIPSTEAILRTPFGSGTVPCAMAELATVTKRAAATNARRPWRMELCMSPSVLEWNTCARRRVGDTGGPRVAKDVDQT